jgi:hypothetical protein
MTHAAWLCKVSNVVSMQCTAACAEARPRAVCRLHATSAIGCSLGRGVRYTKMKHSISRRRWIEWNELSNWMHLQDVEEFKGFHFKSECAVDQQQHQISVLGSIDHAIQILLSQTAEIFRKTHATHSWACSKSPVLRSLQLT